MQIAASHLVIFFRLQQMEEMRHPLAAGLDKVLVYAGAWGPEGFPVPKGDQASPGLDDGGTGNRGVANTCHAPSAASLHQTVWVQAEALTRRARQLHRMGEELGAALQRKMDLVRAGFGIGYDPRGEQSQQLPRFLSKFCRTL